MYLNIASREEQEPTIRLPRNSRQKKKKDGEDGRKANLPRIEGENSSTAKEGQ